MDDSVHTRNESIMKTIDCGDLTIAFVTDFELAWGDWGSGANQRGSWWRPRVPAGFHALGHFGWRSYDNPSNRQAVVVAKDNSRQGDALRRPTSYQSVWGDWGSGSSGDGRFWQPVAPSGYKALGSVVLGSYDDNQGRIAQAAPVMCVREDLVSEGAIGELLYGDWGSGADQDFSSYFIDVMNNYPSGDGFTRLGVNSFVGVASYGKPTSSPVANVLKLRLPHPVAERHSPSAPLREQGIPVRDDQTPWRVRRSTKIPFLAVKDPDRNVDWKVQHSPFYTAEREECWRCTWVERNGTSNQSVLRPTTKVGWSKTNQQKFSVDTGIKVSAEASVGVEGIAGAKVTTEFHLNFGFENSSSLTQLQEDSVSREFKVDPGEWLAVWVLCNRLTIKRDDGSVVTREEFTTQTLDFTTYPTSITKSFG